MMFLTEIEVTRSDGVIEVHEGPMIQAKSKGEAQIKADKMNPELKVIGKYVSTVEIDNEILI